VRKRGLDALTAAIAGRRGLAPNADPKAASAPASDRRPSGASPRTTWRKRRFLSETSVHRLHARLDRVLLHPWLGPPILFALLFVIFQAVFAWATPFADALDAGASAR
jgi:ferrous iron transport protein B